MIRFFRLIFISFIGLLNLPAFISKEKNLQPSSLLKRVSTSTTLHNIWFIFRLLFFWTFFFRLIASRKIQILINKRRIKKKLLWQKNNSLKTRKQRRIEGGHDVDDDARRRQIKHIDEERCREKMFHSTKKGKKIDKMLI